MYNVKALATKDLPYPVGLVTFTGNFGGHDIALNGTVQVSAPPNVAMVSYEPYIGGGRSNHGSPP